MKQSYLKYVFSIITSSVLLSSGMYAQNTGLKIIKPNDQYSGTVRINNPQIPNEGVLDNNHQGTFIPVYITNIKELPARNNDVIKSVTTYDAIAPGESGYFQIDTRTKNLIYVTPPYTLDTLCYAAIARAPQWLSRDLLLQFRKLSKYSTVDDFARLILDSPDSLADEVAFQVAKLSVNTLNDSRFLAGKQVILQNALRIYQTVDSLKYVRLVEHGSFAKRDYYTSAKYLVKDGATGDTLWFEIPKEIYYNYVVNPKFDQEGVYVQDDINNTEQRTYGYFWRDYLWLNPNKSYDYTPVNASLGSEKDDTIQRFGALIQTPKILWDDVETYWPFLRPFNPADHALNVIGNWASRAMPEDVTLPRDFQPNESAYKHNGMCNEDAYLTGGACRTALIPEVYLKAPGEDHDFGAIYERGWNHFEFFRGGFSPTINSQFRGITNMLWGGSYGWTSSIVQGNEPDGFPLNYSANYNHQMCNLVIHVADKKGNPVDGAIVYFWSNDGTGWISNIGFTCTNHTGTINYPAGAGQNGTAAGKQYAIQVYHPKFGYLPDQTHANIITTNGNIAANGGIYTLTFNYTGTMPALNIDTALTLPAHSPYGIHLNFSSNEILTGINTGTIDKDQFAHVDSFGFINCFLLDSINMRKYKSAQHFNAYQVTYNITSGEMQLPLPTNGKWYLVLSNEFNTTNYETYNVTCGLTSNADYSAIPEITASSDIISVYPNPFSNSCHISAINGFKQIEVIDIYGKVVITSRERMNNFVWEPAAGIQNGIYFIKVNTDKGTFISKVILSR